MHFTCLTDRYSSDWEDSLSVGIYTGWMYRLLQLLMDFFLNSVMLYSLLNIITYSPALHRYKYEKQKDTDINQ